MRLTDALRLTPGSVAAFVGGGGKSTALSTLAEEIRPVVLTTTTKLGIDQSNLAPHHRIIRQKSDIDELKLLLEREEAVVLTGEAWKVEPKWLGLSGSRLAEVRKVCVQTGAILLIEADGSRGRSLKAPAQHEPVIPDIVDLVVVTAGLDVVGEPLNDRWVHRTSEAAQVLEVQEGETIAPELVGALLRHPLGGLKNAPPHAVIRVMLTKADDADRLTAGAVIAKEVMKTEKIHSVLLADLMGHDPVIEVISRVGGVVLAAGASTRIKPLKQLIPWRGKPLIWHAVRAAIEGGLDPIVVVLGKSGQDIQSALQGTAVEFIENPNWDEGQSTSVKAGLEAIRARVEAVIFLLADMPFVGGDLVQALVEEHRRTLSPLVAPHAEGRRANPVLFDQETFPALKDLEGERGGRGLFDRFHHSVIPWDRSATLDIDTSEDLKWLRE